MSFQTPITIAAAIRNIEANQYLLPAIQREFVWEHEKIEWLFDSIMRNYPISSFLFWRVEGKTGKNYKFYQFIRDFRQKYKTHNEEVPTNGQSDFTAVLDGQQRLTSLYIGLRGSFAYRIPRLHEENSERVYPTRRLYLNINSPLENEEDGRKFEFKFLTEKEGSSNNKWFLVSEMYGLSDDFDFNVYLDSRGLKANEFTYRSLSTLKNVIHSKQLINYFLEQEQSIDKALNIFIRINSGGEPLNFSDLIMSIAVANWENKDARKEIHALVDTVWAKGFGIQKDFVLKAFLYLHSKDIGFKVTNFSKQNAVEFEAQWDNIRDGILSAFDLVKTYGFSDATLTSKNAMLPVIYYIYHTKKFKEFHRKIGNKQDRLVIRKWLHASLVKRLFSGNSDTVLSQIRKAFTNDIATTAIDMELNEFPVERISSNLKMESAVTEEYIEELLRTQKENNHAFSILALLYPSLDYQNGDFHKDHLHPENAYSQLRDSDRESLGWEIYNSILNLQLLDSNENMSKQDVSLVDWVASQTTDDTRETFLINHLIPNVELSLDKFSNFVDKRRIVLTEKLLALLR